MIGRITLLAASDEHPNKRRFEGVVTFFNAASDAPPGGARGRKVFIPTDVGEAALPTLVGMGVGVRDDLSGHAPKHKIGVIDKAYLGEALDDGSVPACVEGYFYAYDFPDEMEAIDANKDDLGFSYETTQTYVEDDGKTYHVKSLVFTGAACLLKAKAAYTKTSLAAEGDEGMDKAFKTFMSLFLKAAAGEDPTMEMQDENAEMLDELGDAEKVKAAMMHLAEAINQFAEFKEYFGGDGKWGSMSVYLNAAKEQEATIKSLTEKVASLETALTDAQTKLNAAAETEYVAKSDYDALKAQADELQTTVTSLKGEAEAKQAYARKSAPTSLMAKYVPGEVDDLKAAMEVIDNAEGLDTNAKIALKMQLSEKFGKAK